MNLILYSKPGCHLCEGLLEKLQQVKNVQFQLEIRDITTRDDWFENYQFDIPVLCKLESDKEIILPRLSPRSNVLQLEKLLQKFSS